MVTPRGAAIPDSRRIALAAVCATSCALFALQTGGSTQYSVMADARCADVVAADQLAIPVAAQSSDIGVAIACTTSPSIIAHALASAGVLWEPARAGWAQAVDETCSVVGVHSSQCDGWPDPPPADIEGRKWAGASHACLSLGGIAALKTAAEPCSKPTIDLGGGNFKVSVPRISTEKLVRAKPGHPDDLFQSPNSSAYGACSCVCGHRHARLASCLRQVQAVSSAYTRGQPS